MPRSTSRSPVWYSKHGNSAFPGHVALASQNQDMYSEGQQPDLPPTRIFVLTHMRFISWAQGIYPVVRSSGWGEGGKGGQHHGAVFLGTTTVHASSGVSRGRVAFSLWHPCCSRHPPSFLVFSFQSGEPREPCPAPEATQVGMQPKTRK